MRFLACVCDICANPPAECCCPTSPLDPLPPTGPTNMVTWPSRHQPRARWLSRAALPKVELHQESHEESRRGHIREEKESHEGSQGVTRGNKKGVPWGIQKGSRDGSRRGRHFVGEFDSTLTRRSSSPIPIQTGSLAKQAQKHDQWQ